MKHEDTYAFTEEHCQRLEDGVQALESAGYSTKSYETQDVNGNDLLGDPERVAHEYENTLTRALLSRLQEDTDITEINPEDMVYSLYRRTTDEEDPVLGEITFKDGNGGEFIPYNGRSSGCTPEVKYRIADDDTPYFSVSATGLNIQYDSTKQYLADLGLTLHSATGVAIDLPDTVEEDMELDLHDTGTEYSEDNVDNMQESDSTTSAADD